MASLLNWLGSKWESVTPWDEEANRRKRAAQPAPRPTVRPGLAAPSSLNQMNNVPQQTRPAPRPSNKPGFMDYLNPFGEHGLFGVEQQRNFSNASRPIVDALESVQRRIDATDNQQGFQLDDPGDYARFAGKLYREWHKGL